VLTKSPLCSLCSLSGSFWGNGYTTDSRGPKYDELEILSTLVEYYEEKHCPVPPPDLVEAIKFHMDQLGLNQSDVAKYFGGKSRTSEVLSRKRPLSLRMIRNLHLNLKIPSDSLLGLS
jgi:HTH-type transcriptional regulator / antitoxin HigA